MKRWRTLLDDWPWELWAAFVVVLVLIWMVGSAAQAHDFFDTSCCQGGRDCNPAPLKTVRWTPQGWWVETPTIKATVVPFNDPRIRYVPPDAVQQFYICEWPKNKLRCLYQPEPGG